MDKDEQLRRANAYTSIFENPYYTDATDRIRSQLHREFAESKPNEQVTRERIYLSLLLLDKLHAVITATIQSGEIDRKQIAELNGKSKGIRDFF